MRNFLHRLAAPAAFILALAALLSLWSQSGRTQFPSQSAFAGTSTGSCSPSCVYQINVPNAAALSDLTGVPISFIASFTNQGVAQINPSSLGNVTVLRLEPFGPGQLGGGEIIATQLVTVAYDGTNFQLWTNASPLPPGAGMDYYGAGCPVGFVDAGGQGNLTQAGNPGLFSVVSTIWGPATGGNFTMPDMRGRTGFGQDTNHGGLSNRITVAGGNCDGTVVGNACGGQNETLTQAQLPGVGVGLSGTATFTGNTVTPTAGFTGNARQWSSTTTYVQTIGTIGAAPSGSGVFPANSPTFSAVLTNVTPDGSVTVNPVTPSGTIGGTTNAIGGGQSHTVLSPAAIVNKCVRL